MTWPDIRSRDIRSIGISGQFFCRILGHSKLFYLLYTHVHTVVEYRVDIARIALDSDLAGYPATGYTVNIFAGYWVILNYFIYSTNMYLWLDYREITSDITSDSGWIRFRLPMVRIPNNISLKFK